LDTHNGNITYESGLNIYFYMMNPNGNNYIDFKMFLRFYRISTIYL